MAGSPNYISSAEPTQPPQQILGPAPPDEELAALSNPYYPSAQAYGQQGIFSPRNGQMVPPGQGPMLPPPGGIGGAPQASGMGAPPTAQPQAASAPGMPPTATPMYSMPSAPPFWAQQQQAAAMPVGAPPTGGVAAGSAPTEKPGLFGRIKNKLHEWNEAGKNADPDRLAAAFNIFMTGVDNPEAGAELAQRYSQQFSMERRERAEGEMRSALRKQEDDDRRLRAFEAQRDRTYLELEKLGVLDDFLLEEGDVADFDTAKLTRAKEIGSLERQRRRTEQEFDDDLKSMLAQRRSPDVVRFKYKDDPQKAQNVEEVALHVASLKERRKVLEDRADQLFEMKKKMHEAQLRRLQQLTAAGKKDDRLASTVNARAALLARIGQVKADLGRLATKLLDPITGRPVDAWGMVDFYEREQDVAQAKLEALAQQLEALDYEGIGQAPPAATTGAATKSTTQGGGGTLGTPAPRTRSRRDELLDALKNAP